MLLCVEFCNVIYVFVFQGIVFEFIIFSIKYLTLEFLRIFLVLMLSMVS